MAHGAAKVHITAHSLRGFVMRSYFSVAVGSALVIALSHQASAVPIKIKFTGSAGPVSIVTDTTQLLVLPTSDPISGDTTFVSGDFVINGPDPGLPVAPPYPPTGIYTYYQEYEFQFDANFAVSDPHNFTIFGSQIGLNLSTFKIASYEVRSDGTLDAYMDGPTPLAIDSFSISTTLSDVPLPASAPMFGAALMALGAIGYGLKRRKEAAAG